MKQEKSNVGTIVLTVIITVIVISSGMYYFQKTTTQTDQPIVETTKAPQKSFIEYYQKRADFETLGENNNFLMKNPEELGFKELAKVKIVCPENADGPCGSDLLILSKDLLGSGNQEFYLSQAGGAGYSYYGPFTDDLQRIVEESKTISSLKENY